MPVRDGCTENAGDQHSKTRRNAAFKRHFLNQWELTATVVASSKDF